jgi:transcriptional regulator with XRE-family HTH domain
MAKIEIKRIMADRNCSVRQLARKANVSPATIMKARKSLDSCSMETIKSIAKALGMEARIVLDLK